MIKTRADQIQVGDVIDFDRHKYYTLWSVVADDGTTTRERVTGLQTVAEVAIGTYGTQGSSFKHRPASRLATITYTNGRKTRHNFAEKLPVVGS